MNGVEELTIPREEAKAKWKQYTQAIKQARDTETRTMMTELKRVHHRLSRGHGIIDIYQAFKKTGLRHDGYPVLCVAPVGSKQGFCHRNADGGASFAATTRDLDTRAFAKTVHIPSGTYDWPRRDPNKVWSLKGDATISTPAPVLPPDLVGQVNSNPHFILWEVEEWKPEPPRDPILLERVTQNLFATKGAWDLTEIERAVMRGHL